MTVRQKAFEAIGTHWDIHVEDPVSEDDWTKLLENIDQRIESFDKNYSRFRVDSLVTRMSEQSGSYNLPGDGYKLLNFYHQLYLATDGKVTPLIGQVVADAGYDATYSFKSKQLSKPQSWDAILELSTKQLILKQPALLDFGAAGKGYLVDIIGAILTKAKILSYTINAGGDILHRTKREEVLSVGLENPLDTSEAVGIAKITNQSLCASAGSKRKWGKYHHVIDPDKLASPTEVIATWVVANDTMTADGIATALFFTDAAKLRQQFSFEFAVLHRDMSLLHSKDFQVTLFEA